MGESMTSLRPATRDGSDRLTELLARISVQDSRAFAELHRLTRNKLRKAVLAVGTSPCEIDDILQESYLKVWRSAGKFDVGRASVITWMCTIARNTAIDAVRLRKLPTSELDEALSIPNPTESAGSDGFDYARVEPLAAGALARLSEDRRKLVALAYIEGESRVNLAQRYGVPINTIKTWLRRTLETLRKECLATAEA
jgi:RNA polymerase sigma-70 factor, ECF subfamily